MQETLKDQNNPLNVFVLTFFGSFIARSKLRPIYKWMLFTSEQHLGNNINVELSVVSILSINVELSVVSILSCFKKLCFAYVLSQVMHSRHAQLQTFSKAKLPNL
jgi:hypothetical protein